MECFHNCHVELVKGMTWLSKYENIFIIIKWMSSKIVMVVNTNEPYIYFI
jgi:hypothetical protein